MAINYRYHLDVNTIQFWLDQCKTLKLSAERIREATRWCLQDCARFPTWAEFVQRIPQREEESASTRDDPVASIDDPRLAQHGAPWWWGGVKDALGKPPDVRRVIFGRLIAEAQRRGEPEFDWCESEVYQYTDMSKQRISVRSVVNCGWGRWVLDDKGKVNSGRCYRKDKHVILRGTA